MDGASARAVTSSQGKARAALLLGVPTKEAQDAIAAGKPLPVTLTSPPAGAWEITIGQGGLPIMKDGKVVAAMGCGGSLPANDEKILSGRHQRDGEQVGSGNRYEWEAS